MNFSAFVDSLTFMWQGLVGIFVVIGVIIAATHALNRVTKEKTE